METLQVNRKKIEKLSTVLNNSRIKIFEYLVDEDTLVVYNNKFHIEKTIAGYMDYIDNKSKIHPEDREKIKQIYKEAKEATVEIREFGENGDIKHSVLEFTKIVNEDGKLTLIGSTRDITEQRKQEKKLKERARKDSLTGLYNQVYGKKCINKYLNRKKPFDSCGMIVLDVDCFKLVNDNYGHLFGDKVLARLAMLLKEVFRDNDSILMRAGGDEFVIFVKDILNIELVRKNVELMQKIRDFQFGKTGCTITCSAGCCYLPENVSGYTYDQLFENADIALYKAKERGKNCYVYCDSLQHFSSMIAEQEKQEEMLEARYFQNDIVATAFEIFEKTNNFEVAIHLLLKVIGVRLELDRITIVQTDIKDREIYSDYQWNREGIPKVLETVRHFDKEDFLTVFNDFDENGVLVLQHDHMQRYSESATKILIQGEAKTIVCVAMYCEGRYTGAITYVVCKEKRSWSNEMLKQLSEVTKIISAHFAKNQVMNHVYQGAITRMEHDTLTGLISFGRFHEEVERIILANKTSDYMMIYTDFENFKYFNYKYGYTLGDQVLKDFCSFIIGKTEEKHNLYFTRVVSDQFLMFRTASHEKDEYQGIIEETEKINEEFMLRQKEKFPKSNVVLRTGIYYVTPECRSTSYAIDAANYVRQKVKGGEKGSVRFYDDEMQKQRELENEIVNDMKEAMEQKQFKVYFQPVVDAMTGKIASAESLIRWFYPEKGFISPGVFIPALEESGHISELDLYVLDSVNEFQKKRYQSDKITVPVSTNLSWMDFYDETIMNWLEKKCADASMPSGLCRMEITETSYAAIEADRNATLEALREAGILLLLDDFGSGYSSFGMLQNYNFDIMKIDMSFVRQIETNTKTRSIIRFIIEMAHTMDIKIIAEGAETKEQVEFLRDNGCDYIQGYYFYKPMPEEEFVKLLDAGR